MRWVEGPCLLNTHKYIHLEEWTVPSLSLSITRYFLGDYLEKKDHFKSEINHKKEIHICSCNDPSLIMINSPIKWRSQIVWGGHWVEKHQTFSGSSFSSVRICFFNIAGNWISLGVWLLVGQTLNKCHYRGFYVRILILSLTNQIIN